VRWSEAAHGVGIIMAMLPKPDLQMRKWQKKMKESFKLEMRLTIKTLV